MTTIQKVIAAVLALAAFVGLVYKVDGRWARVERLILVEMRLEQKILSDRAKSVRERIWRLEEKFPANPPQPVKEEARELKHELQEINRELEKSGTK